MFKEKPVRARVAIRIGRRPPLTEPDFLGKLESQR